LQNPIITPATLSMIGVYNLTVTNNSTGCKSLVGSTNVLIKLTPDQPLIVSNDLHVLRWLRYQSTELQTYYKLKRKNRTFKFTLNQQLAQTCC
jgi:hypothetical protein